MNEDQRDAQKKKEDEIGVMDYRVDRRKALVFISAGLLTASSTGLDFSVAESTEPSNVNNFSTENSIPPRKEREYDPSTQQVEGQTGESIEDYGGVKGDSSTETMGANVRAIDRASRAADDNTVFLPPGEWYIGGPGDEWGGFALRPGHSSNERGTAGLGFVGAGPEQSFLKFGDIEHGGPNTIRYEGDVASHDNVVWRDLTYDGNYQNFDFSNRNTFQAAVRCFTEFNATIENCRFRNFQQAGFRLQSGTVEVDRCTFRNIGIGRLNQTGDSYSHPFTQGGSDITITNSKFSLVPGSCVNCTFGDKGILRMDSIYAEGIGTNLVKLNDATSVDISRVNYTGQTQELLDAQDDENEPTYNGRWFFRRQSGEDSSAVPVTMHNIRATDTTRGAIRVANGRNMDLLGGVDGPIVFENIAQNRSFDDAIQDPQSTIRFDIEDLSIHDVDGTIFELTQSTGVINRLQRDNTAGLGNTAGVIINEDTVHTNTFVPEVPSRNEVGINTSGSS